jgi:MFS family permease
VSPRPRLEVVPALEPAVRSPRTIAWTLGLGAFGLAWSITTVSAYVPPLLAQFTSSSTIIGLVLAIEGIFAIILPFLVGPLSDATHTPLGRRRPYLLLAVVPMSVSLALVAFTPSLVTTALVLASFFIFYYVYEPPYRGLYPDLLPHEVYGRALGLQHVMRGLALGGALVGGGILLAVWEPFPFVLAAGVTLVACGSIALLIREDSDPVRGYERLWAHLAAPWKIIRRNRTVRRFLIANTAWEATFAGMRTFVVLYIVRGLDQPAYVVSSVLAVVAGGYVLAALVAGRLGDAFGLARVILVASVVYGGGLVAVGFAQEWHWWAYGVVAPVAVAGGTVMTLSWGLLFKFMPEEYRGATTGLAVTTRGLGLLLGPLLVGAAIDLARPYLEATEGYAIVWPAVGLPILAVIPIVVSLARAEARGTRRRATA